MNKLNYIQQIILKIFYKSFLDEVDNIKNELISYKDKIVSLTEELKTDKLITSKRQLGKYKTDIRQLELELYKYKSQEVKSPSELKEITKNESKLKQWSLTVRQANDNTCDVCGYKETTKNLSVFLTAHHLYDKNIHPSLMYIPENGVCLCNVCHNSFHSKYTSKSHCTPSMYNKFKQWKLGQIILGIKD